MGNGPSPPPKLAYWPFGPSPYRFIGSAPPPSRGRLIVPPHPLWLVGIGPSALPTTTGLLVSPLFSPNLPSPYAALRRRSTPITPDVEEFHHPEFDSVSRGTPSRFFKHLYLDLHRTGIDQVLTQCSPRSPLAMLPKLGHFRFRFRLGDRK